MEIRKKEDAETRKKTERRIGSSEVNMEEEIVCNRERDLAVIHFIGSLDRLSTFHQIVNGK